MKKQEVTSASCSRSGSICAIVEDYTDQISQGEKKANPQDFLDRFVGNARKGELKTHLNLATMLTRQGVAIRKQAKEQEVNRKRIEEARQRTMAELTNKKGGV